MHGCMLILLIAFGFSEVIEVSTVWNMSTFGTCLGTSEPIVTGSSTIRTLNLMMLWSISTYVPPNDSAFP